MANNGVKARQNTQTNNQVFIGDARRLTAGRRLQLYVIQNSFGINNSSRSRFGRAV